MTGSRVLAIFAHPDDESFRCGGTLALLARRGVRVQVLTATRGDAGSRGDPPLCRANELAAVRESELRNACAALGIEPPLFLDYLDGALANVDEKEATAQVLAIIQELRPQVLLTWPPDGLSGHPDHVAVSRWTSLAFQRAAALGPDAPAALYHLAVPRSVAEALGLSQLHDVPDEQVSLTVDVGPVWEQKLAAIRCHRTQAGGSPILAASEEKQRLFLGREHFVRAETRAGQDFWKDVFPPEEND
jgi:LmbE family N-acetylglucosaminyl deacetylase